MKNYNDLIFVAKDIRFNHFYILSAKLSAFFDRKSYYKKFCSDNGIVDEKAAKKYLPSRYLVEHTRINRFGKSRDRIIAQAYIDFQNKSLNTDYAIKETERSLEEQKGVIAEYKANLSATKKRLETEKDPAEKIYLQGMIWNITTSIKNQEIALRNIESDYSELLGIEINNDENWKQQLKQIEDEVDNCIVDFIRSLCRRITRRLSYVNFEYVKPEYSEKVKAIKGIEVKNAPNKNKK